ncbi:hypothetical protein [Sulfurimonas sp.]
MKKVISAIMASMLLISIACADKNEMFSTVVNKNSAEIQQKIETLSDYKTLIKDLKDAYKIGDSSKAFVLGSLYMQKIELKNGKYIQPNKKEAIKYFQLALDAGYGLAAMQLSFLKYNFNSPEIFDALALVEKGINAKFTVKSAKTVLSLFYSSLVLEKLNTNIKYVRKAIDILYPEAMSHNFATLDYPLANLLNLAGRTKEANKFLTSACNNPTAPASIKYMCFNGSQIVARNKVTGKIPPKSLKLGCPNAKANPELAF